MINENLARRSKENCSFSDYKAGSATAEFNAEIARVKGIIEKAKERVSPEAQERLDGLLTSYTRNYANWINKRNASGAGHVSVMIAGPANYNMRKHEQYLNRERKLWEEYEQFKNIEYKIQSIISGDKVIRSDDKNAVEKIKAKIELLKGAPDPFGNKSAEIRRLKERLLQLAPEEFAEQQANITVNGVKTYDEIVALWAGGKHYKSSFVSAYDPAPHWYFDLLVDFFDGKRHYRELLNIEVDEAGENSLDYRINAPGKEAHPLTDERKYSLIISKISGSGNKAVIYQHLKSLTPKAQAKAAEPAEDRPADTVNINGESAKVVRNKEDMRLQLMFGGKPDEKTRETLKSNGFRWAPSCMAWQRLLNENAEWALRRIVKV